MIMIIGFVTMGFLVGVLAFCMANESNAEKRRLILPVKGSVPLVDAVGRQAA